MALFCRSICILIARYSLALRSMTRIVTTDMLSRLSSGPLHGLLWTSFTPPLINRGSHRFSFSLFSLYLPLLLHMCCVPAVLLLPYPMAPLTSTFESCNRQRTLDVRAAHADSSEHHQRTLPRYRSTRNQSLRE